MSRKHFRMLADALHRIKPGEGAILAYKEWNACVSAIARVCGSINPRFDYDRFYAACENGV